MTKTSRLSAEEIRQRQEDARRFLNQWRVLRVADASIRGYMRHGVVPPSRLCDGNYGQYRALSAFQPAWGGQ